MVVRTLHGEWSGCGRIRNSRAQSREQWKDKLVQEWGGCGHNSQPYCFTLPPLPILVLAQKEMSKLFHQIWAVPSYILAFPHLATILTTPDRVPGRNTGFLGYFYHSCLEAWSYNFWWKSSEQRFKLWSSPSFKLWSCDVPALRRLKWHLGRRRSSWSVSTHCASYSLLSRGEYKSIGLNISTLISA